MPQYRGAILGTGPTMPQTGYRLLLATAPVAAVAAQLRQRVPWCRLYSDDVSFACRSRNLNFSRIAPSMSIDSFAMSLSMLHDITTFLLTA